MVRFHSFLPIPLLEIVPFFALLSRASHDCIYRRDSFSEQSSSALLLSALSFPAWQSRIAIRICLCQFSDTSIVIPLSPLIFRFASVSAASPLGRHCLGNGRSASTPFLLLRFCLRCVCHFPLFSSFLFSAPCPRRI